VLFKVGVCGIAKGEPSPTAPEGQTGQGVVGSPAVDNFELHSWGEERGGHRKRGPGDAAEADGGVRVERLSDPPVAGKNVNANSSF